MNSLCRNKTIVRKFSFVITLHILIMHLVILLLWKRLFSDGLSGYKTTILNLDEHLKKTDQIWTQYDPYLDWFYKKNKCSKSSFLIQAELGWPMAGLCQLAPAEGLLALLAILLASLVNFSYERT